MNLIDMPDIRNPKNAGWYFHRGFYEKQLSGEVTTELIKTKNFSKEAKTMTDEVRFSQLASEPFPANSSFDLTICYSGLLAGSGYQHETGALEEFKIGFYFDYTTGLPQIPGSSVKGALRSFFPDRNKGDLRESKYRYILTIVNEVTKDRPLSQEPSIEKIMALELEIFEGKNLSQGHLPIYLRDRFYDAILSPLNKQGTKYLGSDFVTPHPEPLGNPIPLKFLKILPEIIIRFRFELTDSAAIKGLTKKHKEELFKRILLDTGIGAKTNVGYGQFRETVKVPAPTAPEVIRQQAAVVENTTPIPPTHTQIQPKDTIPSSLIPYLKQNSAPLEGEITSVFEGKVEVRFWKSDKTKSASILRRKIKKGKDEIKDFSLLKVGQKVYVYINADFNITAPLNCSIKIP